MFSGDNTLLSVIPGNVLFLFVWEEGRFSGLLNRAKQVTITIPTRSFAIALPRLLYPDESGQVLRAGERFQPAQE